MIKLPLCASARLIAFTLILGATLACSSPTANAVEQAEQPASAAVASTGNVERARITIPVASGPFGLSMAMTEAELQQSTTGFKKGDKNGVYIAASVPKPHADFESYLMTLTNASGLCKVSALGIDIEMNSFGTEVKSKFEGIREALTAKYGKPQIHDFVAAGSIWNEPEDWAMGLLKKERVLASLWQFQQARPDDNITGILLQAHALSRDKAYLMLSYEFQNLDVCSKELKKSNNAAF